ncbi:SPASM domain-containing protein [Butyrivibrio fibrisolvens]|uniref:SPASM domain-containing protein n=1 Tax=Butyrivibrio fibrisolvens TaxID=831 RepID=UPI0003B751A7|nr:SPASM domain-containing protein [Butyrivibrio fibrisolvens]
MKLCKRAVDFVQVVNEDGAVRLCSWLYDGGVIGYLTKNSFKEIYHSNEAKLIREMHANGDHANCNPNQCPYVANNNVEEYEIEIDEVPKVPESLFLAYENVCNYHCVMCGIPGCHTHSDAKELEKSITKLMKS